MGVPNTGWFVRENPIYKWMMTGGTPMTMETSMTISVWFQGSGDAQLPGRCQGTLDQEEFCSCIESLGIEGLTNEEATEGSMDDLGKKSHGFHDFYEE